MKKHDKMKKIACQFFGCPLEANTLILLMKSHYDPAPGIEKTPKTLQKTSKNMKNHEEK